MDTKIAKMAHAGPASTAAHRRSTTWADTVAKSTAEQVHFQFDDKKLCQIYRTLNGQCWRSTKVNSRRRACLGELDGEDERGDDERGELGGALRGEDERGERSSP